jgi:hypothetical protein
MRYVRSSQSCALATLSVEHDCRTANALASVSAQTIAFSWTTCALGGHGRQSF